jgi:hypothetical protein
MLKIQKKWRVVGGSLLLIALVASVFVLGGHTSARADVPPPPSEDFRRRLTAGSATIDYVAPSPAQVQQLRSSGVSVDDALRTASEFGATDNAKVYFGVYTDHGHKNLVTGQLYEDHVLAYAVNIPQGQSRGFGSDGPPGPDGKNQNADSKPEVVVFVNAMTGGSIVAFNI